MYVGSHNDEVVDEDGLHGLIVSLANMGHFGRTGMVVMGPKKSRPELRQRRAALGYDDLPSTLVITLRWLCMIEASVFCSGGFFRSSRARAVYDDN